MNLEYIINHLKDGELNQANLGFDTEDGVNSNNLGKVINYINSGLVSLYTRFNLKTKEVKVEYNPSINQYFLKVEHAVSNTSSTLPKYILDADFPFSNDVLQIQKVTSEDELVIFPLNDSSKPDSVILTGFNSFKLPPQEDRFVFTVHYRATPSKLQTEGKCLLDQEVDLPLSHLQALGYYVAHRYYSSRGGMESLNESQVYMNKYLMECEFLTTNGVYKQDNTATTNFERNGWV